MSVSKAQLVANRENAKLSTGPKTAEGKAKIRLNSLKDGFAGATVVIAEHQKPAYKAHFESFKTEFRPVGPSEEFLTTSLAEISWTTQQIRTKAQTILTMIGTRQDHLTDHGDPTLNFELAQAANLQDNLKEVNLLGIYEQRKMRLFNSTRRELIQMQAERKQRELEELEEAAATRQTAPAGWQPSHDGFACSLAEIDRYTRRMKLRYPASVSQKPSRNG